MANEKDIGFKITAQTDGLKGSLNQASSSIKTFASQAKQDIEQVGSSFSLLSTALASVVSGFALSQITEMLNKFSELGEEIERTAAMTGLAADKIQLFQAAVTIAGGDIGSANQTLLIFQKNIGEAISSAGPARTAFEGMGFSLAQLKNTDVIDLLYQIKERMNEAGDSAEQSALKQEYLRATLGRGGAQILALKESLSEMKELVKKTGYEMSPEMLGKANDLDGKLDELHLATSGLAKALSGLLAPAYATVVEGTTSAIEKTTKFIEVLSYANQLTERSRQINSQPPEPGAFINGKSLSQYTNQKNYGVPFGPDKPTNPLPPLLDGGGKGGGKGDNTAEKLAQEKIQTELNLSRISFENKKQAAQAELELGNITKTEQIAQLRQFAAEEFQIQDAILQRQQNDYTKGSLEYQKALDKRKILTAQYNSTVARLNVEAIKADQAQWKSFGDTVKGAFDTMLTGILQGTQTWRQAMANLFSNLALTFVKEQVGRMIDGWVKGQAAQTAATAAGTATRARLETAGGISGFLSMIGKKVASWVLGETAMTGATVAGVGARTVAEGTGEAASLAMAAATAAKNIATLTADGALVFGGVFANLAPFLGPAAAGPAGVAQAAVMAQLPLVSLPSAAGGWVVPNDTLAQIHEDEMVLPAHLSQGIQSMISGGGGGGGVNIHLSAIDARSGAQFLMDNAAHIAKAVSGQVRNANPHLTGAR